MLPIETVYLIDVTHINRVYLKLSRTKQLKLEALLHKLDLSIKEKIYAKEQARCILVSHTLLIIYA